MHLIAGLCAEHRELENHSANLLAIVALDAPDPAAAALARSRMAALLADHCAREDRFVYDRLLASGDASATAAAWLCRQQHGSVTRDFGRYIADWPVGRVALEWAAFRAETRTALAALALRIEREESALYPHADRVMSRRAA